MDHGGGSTWFPVTSLANTRPAGLNIGSKVPKVAPPREYSNILNPDTGGSFKRRRSTASASKLAVIGNRDNTDMNTTNPVSFTAEEWQVITSSNPALQCQGKQGYADVFGWESSSKGVWVLETRLRSNTTLWRAFPGPKMKRSSMATWPLLELRIMNLTKSIQPHLPSWVHLMVLYQLSLLYPLLIFSCGV